jgi:hypothetical protein
MKLLCDEGCEMIFLKEKHSMSSLSHDIGVGFVVAALLARHERDALDRYATEFRSLRSELAEAAELASVFKKTNTPPSVLVDVGCGNGLLSLAVSALLDCRLIWVDRDASCRASRFCKLLQIEFRASFDQLILERQALVLAVNVCSQSLLDVISWYKRSENPAHMLCVPCCGFAGLEYEGWLVQVENALGKCTRQQLSNNLKRVALVTIT